MNKRYRSWNLDQDFLLPPSPKDWLPKNHKIYMLLDILLALDLSEFHARLAAKGHSGPETYSPTMMLGLLIWGYCTGVRSSRKIARATYEDLAFRVLAAGDHPHFTRVADFRLEFKDLISGVFQQVLVMFKRMGVDHLGKFALDGTKVQANASKHKAMSYERMKQDEVRLRGEIEELLRQAEAIEHQENEELGPGRDGEEIPAELERRETRLKRIEEVRQELENEAKAARAEELREEAERQRQRAAKAQHPGAAALANQRAQEAEEKAKLLDPPTDAPPPQDWSVGADPDTAELLPHHRVPHDADGVPEPRAQRNFTDPDSRIMAKNGRVSQDYNAHAVADENQIIWAAEVTNQAPDCEHLPALLKQTVNNLDGQKPEVFLADTGYFSAANVDFAETLGVDPLIAVGRQKHGVPEQEAAEQTEELSPAHEDAASAAKKPPQKTPKQKMKGELAKPENKAAYARRKVIIEPVFGQIKEIMGFRRFLLRGIEKVRAEWKLVCLSHNILKLIGFMA